MKRAMALVISIGSSCAVSAVPELSFPAGSCSGIIEVDDPVLLEKSDRYFDGDASFSFVLDFDEAEAFGVSLLFDDFDGDNEAYAQWAADQDASGIPLALERDDLMPASFIGSMTIDRPDDNSVPTLVGIEPTGNYFKEFTFRFRLLPIAGGSAYIVQGLTVPVQGLCAAI
jgi:hypothetical protein